MVVVTPSFESSEEGIVAYLVKSMEVGRPGMAEGLCIGVGCVDGVVV